MNYDSLSEVFRAYFFSTGWEGVWAKNYSRIMKVPINDRAKLQRQLKKRFGPNRKRKFLDCIFTTDSVLSRIKK